MHGEDSVPPPTPIYELRPHTHEAAKKKESKKEKDGDDAPPSHLELYGQFYADPLSVLTAVCGSAFEAVPRIVQTTVVYVLSYLVPVGFLVLGAVNVHNCAAQPMIPIWLIVLGSLYLVRAAVCCYIECKQSSARYTPHICIGLFNALLVIVIFVWLILGSVWVFGTWPAGSPGSPHYCDRFMYTFAFIFIILSYVILVLSCFGFCCLLGFLCYVGYIREKRKKLSGDRASLSVSPTQSTDSLDLAYSLLISDRREKGESQTLPHEDIIYRA